MVFDRSSHQIYYQDSKCRLISYLYSLDMIFCHYNNLVAKSKGAFITELNLVSPLVDSDVNQYVGTVMAPFDHIMISTRGKWVQTNPPEHESDDCCW